MPTSQVRKTLAAAYSADDRRIVGVVGLDPSLRGSLGLCVWRLDDDAPLAYWSGPAPLVCGGFATTAWLGSQVSRSCEPGERLVLAAESNAFGARVGRALGRVVGSVEGLLLDLNAIAPETLVDVAAYTWRHAAGIATIRGRARLKEAAVDAAARYSAAATGMPHDAAEATLLARYVVHELRRLRAAGEP